MIVLRDKFIDEFVDEFIDEFIDEIINKFVDEFLDRFGDRHLDWGDVGEIDADHRLGRRRLQIGGPKIFGGGVLEQVGSQGQEVLSSTGPHCRG